MVRDALEDALRDATHDAFMAFWRAADTLAAEQLWLAYCVAQERYEAVMARQMGRYYWLAREQSHHAKKQILLRLLIDHHNTPVRPLHNRPTQKPILLEQYHTQDSV